MRNMRSIRLRFLGCDNAIFGGQIETDKGVLETGGQIAFLLFAHRKVATMGAGIISIWGHHGRGTNRS